MRTQDLGSDLISADDDVAQSGGDAPLCHPPLIGRQRELLEMAGALERAASGIATVVTLSGEPGIGKTRLAREFGRLAAAREARVLWANCRSGGEGCADYWPWRQIFRALARDAGNQSYAAFAPQPGMRADENRLPSSPAAGETAPYQNRFDRFDVVSDRLEDLSREQPLVLVFDDVHGADDGSLALLAHFLCRIGDCPILALLTYRPLALRNAGGLARMLSEAPMRNAVTISLGQLSSSEIGEMLRGHGNDSAQMAAPLVRIAGGNPGFVQLLARKGASGAGPLDPELHAVVEEHLSISPHARELMEAASVIGERFNLPVLLAVSGADPAQFLDCMSEAQAAGLVRESVDNPGSYFFVYPLVCAALYDRVTGARRAALHRRVANALEELARGDDGLLATIAEHFFRGLTLGDASKTLEYCERAAQHALAVCNFPDALRFYRSALTAADSGPGVDRGRRARLLLGLGEAQHALGEIAQARRVFKQAAELAESSSDPDLHAQALLGWAGWPAVPGYPDQRVMSALEAAISALDPSDSSARASLMIRLAVELHAVPSAAERRAALLAVGIDMARRLGDGRALLRGLRYRHDLLSGPGAVEDRVANAQEMMEAALASGRNEDYSVAFAYRYSSLIAAGKVAQADAEAGPALAQAANPEQPWMRFAEDCFGAMRNASGGRFAEAEQMARRALSFARPFRADFEDFFWTAMLTPFEEKGRLAELLPLAEKAAQNYPIVPLYRAMLAQIQCASGQPNAARENFEHLAVNGFDALARDVNYPASVAALARVCAALGDANRAAMLYTALEPYRAGDVVFGPLTYLGPVSYYLGLLACTAGNLDQAEADFTAAVSGALQAGARPWIAYASYQRALALSERGRTGDREGALDALTFAEEIAASLAMDKLGVQIAQVKADSLARIDEKSAPAASAGAESGDEKRCAISEKTPRESDNNGTKAPEVGRLQFREEGDTCLFAFSGRTVRIRVSRGLKLMLVLLSNPGREFHVSDVEMPGSVALRVLTDRGKGEPRLDAPAKASYRLKLQELREELDEARRFNDLARVSRIEEEIGFLARELARAVGLNGHDRQAYSDAERARSRVTQAIRSAIRNITAHDQVLGWHLAKSVQTGKFCCYRPGP